MNRSMIWVLPAALTLCLACNGEFDKQVELAKGKKCDMKAAEAKLAKKPDDMMLKEEVARLQRAIENHAEVSGKASELNKQVEAHSCP